MSFDVGSYLVRLAEKLIHDFDMASLAGHSTMIGDARENPARKQLENLLPGSTRVGSGIVIDTHGGKSRQQDLVLYEGNHCPVFSINNTSSASFFPVEGVIATGEIKSSMSKAVMETAFENVRSIKSLNRYINNKMQSGEMDSYLFRPINTSNIICGSEFEKYDQKNKSSDQVFSFILCHKISGSLESFKKNCGEFYRSTPKNLQPNLVISLKDGFFCPVKIENGVIKEMCRSPMDGNAMAFCDSGEKGFRLLIDNLLYVISHARSVPLDYVNRYLSSSNDPGYQLSCFFYL